MTYPNKIFLRNYPPDEKEVWCETRQSPNDIEYIKRDLLESAIREWQILLDSME